jgi:hypothetical protein
LIFDVFFSAEEFSSCYLIRSSERSSPQIEGASLVVTLKDRLRHATLVALQQAISQYSESESFAFTITKIRMKPAGLGLWFFCRWARVKQSRIERMKRDKVEREKRKREKEEEEERKS